MAASENTTVLETAGPFSFQARQRGLWRQAFDRLRRNRVALFAGLLLLILISMAFLTEVLPAVERYPAHEQQYDDLLGGPSSNHWMGTDNLGRDTWARVWEGTRISLKIGVGTQVLVLIVGLTVGACAALGGRLTDNILMRFTDLVYAFPDLLAIILMRAILTDRAWPIIGNGDPQIPGLPGILIQVIVAIAIVSWVTLARLVRGQMLDLRNADYVLAARSIGAGNRRIVFTHMLPNTLGPVIVAVTFGIPAAIFAETFLGFIGFGLPPPTASLGTLVREGQQFIRVNEWLVVAPAVAIALLTLCFTFLGDGLRDALDPRTRR
ncbi:MAG TPA: ABC transporter permease [Tepidiformaceae bacterium]|nr:ABC transporter permease [Tepidiformaceae bacterium]